MFIPETDEACTVVRAFLERITCDAKAHAIDALAATDLTFTQIRVLFVVGEAEEPMSLHQIAEAINLSLAAAGRSVDRLVGIDLVDRREDPVDRRVKRISLTVAGQRLVDDQLTVQQGVVADFVGRLPAAKRIALTDALKPIVDADVDYFGLNRPVPPTSVHEQKVPS